MIYSYLAVQIIAASLLKTKPGFGGLFASCTGLFTG
jgi:hypothetical protein